MLYPTVKIWKLFQGQGKDAYSHTNFNKQLEGLGRTSKQDKEKASKSDGRNKQNYNFFEDDIIFCTENIRVNQNPEISSNSVKSHDIKST